jgi:tetratricopeptide (TPR) repeat protein
MASHDDTAAAQANSLARAMEALRAGRAESAERSCRDHLLLRPGSTPHIRLLAQALLAQQRDAEAEQQLRFALSLEPDSAQIHEDLGSLLLRCQRPVEAVSCFEAAIRLDPRSASAHRKLGKVLVALGRGEDADRAYTEFLELDKDRGAVAAGLDFLRAGKEQDAVESFRDALKKNPDNVDAMRFLAGVYRKQPSQLGDAEALLRRATQLAGDYLAAWLLLGGVLIERIKLLEAADAYRRAIALDENNAEAWAGLGNALSRAGDPEGGVQAYARAVALDPDMAGVQMGYAHALKTIGDQAGALAAYRAAIRCKPDFGEVYWSMANLKVFRFEEHEVEAMEAQLAHGGLSDSAEIHFHFALGKAYDDRKDYATAWRHYDAGNRKQRPLVKHDPVDMELRHQRIIETFDAAFLAEHAGHGCESAAPIFIIGLPRSGSTLIEQILASHSQVEGTAELPILGRIVVAMGRYRSDRKEYPELLGEFRRKDWRAYGLQYLEDSRAHRYTGRPHFTDKLPNNFPHVGLLQLILPNAKIIDARRHPLDSLLGNYQQLYGKGQNFSYDIVELAEYYKTYHRLMTHWQRVLPGKVLEVNYEDTVTRLEWQVRRILDHCDLPFEEQCLRFHETERAVKTASSEQVRQPIYTGSLGKWRRYEQELGYWIEELGSIIDTLPAQVRDAGLQSL